MTQVRWLYQGERRVGACRGEGMSGAVGRTDIRLHRALVVDDHPVHRLLMSGMLNLFYSGMVVEEAEDGLQAQAMLGERHYDIVLCDWFMPHVDGLRLARWLRSGEVRSSPFVLFSARDEVDEIVPLFSSHEIDGYLIKPFDRDAMLEVISVSLGHLAGAA